MKQKMTEHIQSIVSYSRLIETVANMPINTPTVQSVRGGAETESDFTMTMTEHGNSQVEKALMFELKKFEEKLLEYRLTASQS